MTVVGYRSPIEAEHDMPPAHVLAVEWPEELPGFGGRVEVVADDTGAIPTFSTEACAAMCADELRGALPGLNLKVVACWRTFPAQTLLGGRDPADLTNDELERLTLRAYVFEAQTHGAADALHQARGLGRRIVASWGRRFDSLIGKAA